MCSTCSVHFFLLGRFGLLSCLFFFFFFQAEDGIRDGHVTGVQTCALPISRRRTAARRSMTWVPWTYGRLSYASGYGAGIRSPGWYDHLFSSPGQPIERWLTRAAGVLRADRSEERRVGKAGSRAAGDQPLVK